MIATCDPDILIEEQRPGFIIYRRASNGQRWVVEGYCDSAKENFRACMVGAVVDGVLVETVEQARALPTPELDCPVGVGFSGCCDLRIEEL